MIDDRLLQARRRVHPPTTVIPRTPLQNEQTDETESLGWSGSWSLQTRGDPRKHGLLVEPCVC